MHFFPLQNTKGILKNVGNQTVLAPMNVFLSQYDLNCLDTNTLQNILFYVSQNKAIESTT